VCSFVRLFVCCSFVVRLLFVCSFLRLFVSSFVRFFVSSFLRFFVSSFLRFFVSSFQTQNVKKIQLSSLASPDPTCAKTTNSFSPCVTTVVRIMCPIAPIANPAFTRCPVRRPTYPALVATLVNSCHSADRMPCVRCVPQDSRNPNRTKARATFVCPVSSVLKPPPRNAARVWRDVSPTVPNNLSASRVHQDLLHVTQGLLLVKNASQGRTNVSRVVPRAKNATKDSIVGRTTWIPPFAWIAWLVTAKTEKAPPPAILVFQALIKTTHAQSCVNCVILVDTGLVNLAFPV